MRTLLPRAGRRALLAGAAVIALAAAGIAIAGPGSPAGTNVVSATFFANTLVRSHSDTCTPTSGDSYTSTDAIFSGTASSSDVRLAGPITVHVRSVYDSTTNVGSLTGDVDVQTSTNPAPPNGSHFRARLDAVNVNGVVQGWLDGNLGDGSHFVGSLSATFSPTGGFSSSGAPATIGAGSSTNAAIVFGGHCDKPKPTPPSPQPHPNPPNTPPNHPPHPNGPKPEKHHHHHHHDD